MKAKNFLFTVLIAALLISSGMAARQSGYEADHTEQRQPEARTFAVRSGGYVVNARAHTVSLDSGRSEAGRIVSSYLFFPVSGVSPLRGTSTP
jgi:hypothetical protein